MEVEILAPIGTRTHYEQTRYPREGVVYIERRLSADEVERVNELLEEILQRSWDSMGRDNPEMPYGLTYPYAPTYASPDGPPARHDASLD